jgi:hypothetical protein
VFQTFLQPGEALVQPTYAFMGYGFQFPNGHDGTGTASVTVTLGSCVASYDTIVDFVAASDSPRLVVNSAQRVSVECPPAAVAALPIWSRALFICALATSLLWLLRRTLSSAR